MLEHQSMVFSIALRVVTDRGVAEEVAQDVFLELHAQLPELESPEHVLFWLRRVTTHRSIDALRRRKSRPETPMDWNELPEIPDTSAAEDDEGLSSRLQQLVASLPAIPRSVVVLRYQEEMSPEQIAAALQMPVATVKSHLQRSLRLLREKAARSAPRQKPWVGPLERQAQ
ncbi:RNA polymerase sigma factor [Silvibacterium dinghuense]|nr:RNA polymerase sigma factor [Silvibacterium dinghuense]